MVVWALTAGIGIYLLAVGIGTQRAAGLARARAAAATATAGPAAAAPGSRAAGTAAAPDVTESGAPAMGTQALAVVLGAGGQAPAAPPIEGSPLLEFVHPALALLGLTFWICFVMTGYRLFAWIAFGVVVATVAAGLGWEFSRRHAMQRKAAAGRRDGGGGPDGTSDGPGFPPHLVLAHGAAAVCTFALVVIAALVAGHG